MRVGTTDFVVICGFLGSGKTTLISDFLQAGSAQDTAVIVNDAGEINVDGAVLAEAGDLTLARLSNGCVCCSLANDLLYTIEALIAQRDAEGLTPFRRIILECSGLSDPGPVIRSLAALARHRFRVMVLCTCACGSDGDLGARFKEATAQLAAAHRIVLTKTDLMDGPKGVTRAATAARRLAPLGDMLIEPNQLIRAQRAFVDDLGGIFSFYQKWSPAGLLRSNGQINAHPRLSAYQLRCGAPLDWPLLCDWLENVVGSFGGRILRIKGIVKLLGISDPVLIQGVGEHLDQPRVIHVSDTSLGLFLVLRDVVPGELDKVGPALPEATLVRLSGRQPNVGGVSFMPATAEPGRL